MKDKKAECKMDVCYINAIKIFTEYTRSICTSFLEIDFWQTAVCYKGSHLSIKYEYHLHTKYPYYRGMKPLLH